MWSNERIDLDNCNSKLLSKTEAKVLVQALQKQIDSLNMALGGGYDPEWENDEKAAFNQFESDLMQVERSIKRVMWALDKPMGIGGEQ